jgi:hypothetical protein
LMKRRRSLMKRKAMGLKWNLSKKL